MIFPRMSLHCKLVTVGCRECEYGPLPKRDRNCRLYVTTTVNCGKVVAIHLNIQLLYEKLYLLLTSFGCEDEMQIILNENIVIVVLS